MHRDLIKYIGLLFLSPLSLLWSLIYRIRRFLYNYGFIMQNQFAVPIISVGNLSFGGTGKTPMVLWLADFLHSQNQRVMILTRGYQSKRENSAGILRSKKKIGLNPLEFGDEPMLLARRLKNGSVVVGKDRSANLGFYFDSEKPDIVLLDDGHQHLKLFRDLNILLFDSTMPLARYHTAPRGYLREGPSAIRDANAIIFSKRDRVGSVEIEKLKEFIKPYVTAGTIFAEVGSVPVAVFNANRTLELQIPELPGVKVICVAAIASPHPFFDLVRSLNMVVLDTIVYPDHHYFSAREIEGWLTRAKREDAFILVTEKDIVKIKKLVDDDRIRYLEIDSKFFSGEEELKSLVKELVREKGAR